MDIVQFTSISSEDSNAWGHFAVTKKSSCPLSDSSLKIYSSVKFIHQLCLLYYDFLNDGFVSASPSLGSIITLYS